ncbi:MAG: murein biosynthesis integral membrane protein MurJ [Thermanaeromonas sp.]|uniref:murein biosynthesis integral membrane protein MurJ n=1 Tax=Thermanaeromonas sp. TaxID=2003697 RepID=UPI00243A03AC|nr:murein biosynthesis integral membrane protein MurJ [Thermanaeromonas sp.]MCG0277424.1 murein biosynthesis integral membrane protein MurJ [Thermanaeromonas sp.]
MESEIRGGSLGRLARATFTVFILNFASRLLGFIRDAVIAGKFGAGPETDAYMVAYTIPYFLQTVLGMAFVTVLVPALTAYLVKGEREEAWKVASALINWTGLILVVLAVVGGILAPFLVDLLAPGFPANVEGLAVRLTRILFFSLPIMGTGMVVSGILNSGYRFTSPALAPAVSNIIIIASALSLAGSFGIYGLALGTVASFLAFLFVQVPELSRLGFRYFYLLHSRHPMVRRVGIYLPPVIFSLAVNQVYQATNRFFASHLAPGSITALDLGLRLVSVPLGVFAAAVSTAVFPALSEEAARGRTREMATLTCRGISLVAFMVLPTAVAFIVLREPLVRLVFERGAFGTHATLMTAEVVFYASWGLLAQVAQPILLRTFYALGEVVVPAVTGLASVGLNAVFSLLLAPALGHGGLALSNSLAASFYVLALYTALKIRLPFLETGALLKRGGSVGLASIFMGILLFILSKALYVFEPSQATWVLGLKLGFLAGASFIIFLALASVFKVEEIRLLREVVGRRFRGLMR